MTTLAPTPEFPEAITPRGPKGDSFFPLDVTGKPSDSEGVDGQVAVDWTAGLIYRKQLGRWDAGTKIGALRLPNVIPMTAWNNALGDDGDYAVNIFSARVRRRVGGVWREEKSLNLAAAGLLRMAPSVMRAALGQGPVAVLNEDIRPSEIDEDGIPDIGPAGQRAIDAGFRELHVVRDDANYPAFHNSGWSLPDYGAAGTESFTYPLTDAIKLRGIGWPVVTPAAPNQGRMIYHASTGGTTNRGANSAVDIQGFVFKGRGIRDNCECIQLSNSRFSTVANNFYGGWKKFCRVFSDKRGGSDGFMEERNSSFRIPYSIGPRGAIYDPAAIEEWGCDVHFHFDGPLVDGGQVNDPRSHASVLVDVTGVGYMFKGHNGVLSPGDGVSDNAIFNGAFTSGDAQRHMNARKVVAISGDGLTITMSSTAGEFLPSTAVDGAYAGKILWATLPGGRYEARWITAHNGGAHQITIDSAIPGLAVDGDIDIAYCSPWMRGIALAGEAQAPGLFLFPDEVGTAVYYAAGQRAKIRDLRAERLRPAVIDPAASPYVMFLELYNIVSEGRHIIRRRYAAGDPRWWLPMYSSSPAPGVSEAIKSNWFMQSACFGRFDADNFGERGPGTALLNMTSVELEGGMAVRVSSNGYHAVDPVAYTNGTGGHFHHVIIFSPGGETYPIGAPCQIAFGGVYQKVWISGTCNPGDLVVTQNGSFYCVALPQASLALANVHRVRAIILAQKETSTPALVPCYVF